MIYTIARRTIVALIGQSCPWISKFALPALPARPLVRVLFFFCSAWLQLPTLHEGRCPISKLSTAYIDQIHPSCKAELDLRTLTVGSHKIVTWLCSQHPSHEWRAAVCDRALKGSGCPFCSNRRVCATNSLENYPLIARELLPFNNDGLTAAQIIQTSNEKCMWHCYFCDYEWEKEVRLRTQRGSCCPRCLTPGLNISASELRTSGHKHFTENADCAILDQHDSTYAVSDLPTNCGQVYGLYHVKQLRTSMMPLVWA